MELNIVHENFYRAFEDRFRGSRDEIRARLEAYTPFLDTIQPLAGDKQALDLGCGRGEWLELLRDRGFSASGVDLDEQMLAASRERDLDVHMKDAIEAVSAAETGSLAIVSGFHIAEHLPFTGLQTLVSEAHRALMPGGLLILETPNPENLKVSSLTFHLDPTHQKPLPPALLQFMAEYYGFASVKIVRLQERPGITQTSSPTVEDLIYGVSPDYSIVARKTTTVKSSAVSKNVFDESYGISDHEIINKYDRSNQELLGNITDDLNDIRANYQFLLDAINRGNQERHTQEQAFKIFVETEREESRRNLETLQALYNSTSWKVTAPLRAVSRAVRWFLQGSSSWIRLHPSSRPRRLFRSFLTHAMLWLRQRPRLARLVLKCLRQLPFLEQRLIESAQSRGMALSLRPTEPAGLMMWNIDIEPEVISKWEEHRK